MGLKISYTKAFKIEVKFMGYIEDIEAKLNMTGSQVLLKNDFGIIYRNNSISMNCIKITRTKNGIVTTRENNVFDVSVSKHFITMFDDKLDTGRIFVKNSPNNIVADIGGVYYIVSCNEKGVSIYDWKIPWESPIILIVSMQNRLYMINYSGKIMDITPKTRTQEPMLAGITYDSKKHRFYVGYGFGKDDRGYGRKTLQIIDKLILKTDRNFKDITYFDFR